MESMRRAGLKSVAGMPMPETMGNFPETAPEHVNPAVAELETRVRQQAAVARLGLRALSGVDLRTLADEVLAEACCCLGTPMAAALEIREGLMQPLAERGVRFPPDMRGGIPGTPGGLLLTTRKPVVIEDIRSDARFSRSAVMEAAGARSCAAVLVESGPQSLATLTALDIQPRRFSREDVDFLQSLANVLAAAILRSREEESRARLEKERHDAEQALRQSEEKLRQSQKIEAVGRLAGGIAHDFNNLLTAILTTAQMALADLPAEGSPLRADLTDIRGAAEKAASLTRQLLAFSRRQVLRPRVLDLCAAVADIQKMLARLISEDIRLVSDMGQGCTVCADPGQIEQVILNLALNARDAMPGGGTLTLRTCAVDLEQHDGLRMFGCSIQRGRYVRLTVEDTGAGMDEHTLQRIFEPFFTTKEIGKGTGLGLATVYGIVKQSGGYIRATSTVGKGSTFEVYLPVALGEAASAAPEAPQEMPAGRGETVLLVEDEDAVRMAARKALSRGGFRVVEARNGEEALQRWRERTAVDLVISDLVMPEMGGRELATRLRQDDPRLKVLFTSGYTDDASVRQGALASGMAFLSKPFTPEALVRKAREMLDQGS
jgi:signal transduction histidine kinase